jgi:hypothetical protein
MKNETKIWVQLEPERAAKKVIFSGIARITLFIFIRQESRV